MPRLSLYRPNRTNDYKFIDRTVAEMYQVGGVDMYLHKYLGPKPSGDDSSSINGGTQDTTQPAYSEENPLFIEDLFLLENRDRSYSEDVYTMRGVYNQQDVDFDLTQFGLFLNNDTLFITFHYNAMIDTIGRKLMAGDVLELPNLKDYHPLDDDITKALPKYYVVQDASFASEGFSQTWLPHLWRIKATPLVGAQEYKDILDQPFQNENIWDNGNYYPSGSIVLDGATYYQAITDVDPGVEITNTSYWSVYSPASGLDTITTKTKDTEINDAILSQAEFELPLSGYDTSKFYIVSTNADGTPGNPATDDSAEDDNVTPRAEGYTLGYLTGDAVAPNGLPVTPGVSFPLYPDTGDYALRLDYFPNRLFRYDGNNWVKVEDGVRTNIGASEDNTLRGSFVNNTGTVDTVDRGEIDSRQSLSNLLKPEADN